MGSGDSEEDTVRRSGSGLCFAFTSIERRQELGQRAGLLGVVATLTESRRELESSEGSLLRMRSSSSGWCSL